MSVLDKIVCYLILVNYSSAGLKALRDVGVDVVAIDPCSDAECAAESATLASWQFQDLKSVAKRKPDCKLMLHGSDEIGLVGFGLTSYNKNLIFFIETKGSSVGKGID